MAFASALNCALHLAFNAVPPTRPLPAHSVMDDNGAQFTFHDGAVTAGKPREDKASAAARRPGKRLAKGSCVLRRVRETAARAGEDAGVVVLDHLVRIACSLEVVADVAGGHAAH